MHCLSDREACAALQTGSWNTIRMPYHMKMCYMSARDMTVPAILALTLPIYILGMHQPAGTQCMRNNPINHNHDQG